jgi:hypothetical protein
VTSTEAHLYRWFEVFTLTGGALDTGTNEFALCLKRKWVKPVPGGYDLTPAGRKWYDTRSAAIKAACDAGEHEWARKTAFGTTEHCMWCVACKDEPCGECKQVRFDLPDITLPDTDEPNAALKRHYLDDVADRGDEPF